MHLPKVIDNLVAAQNSFNSVDYAACFSETAVVFDEGKMHKGRKEIERWIDKANKDYHAMMKPLYYSETDQLLKTEVSGNFPGSPIVMTYHLSIADGLIQSLKIV